MEVSLHQNRVSLRLTGAQLDCRPRFQRGELESLELTSRVEAKLEQWEREPTEEELEEIRASLQEQLASRMRLTLGRLKSWRSECVGIGSRVAIAAPWHWDGLEDRWQEVFADVECELEVRVSLG